MIKLNRYLFALIMILIMIAAIGTVASDDGFGSVSDDDETPTEDVSYDEDSNDSSVEPVEDDGEDEPLDEEYYDSNSQGEGDGNRNTYVADLSKHPTSNPIAILLLSLINVCGLLVKHTKMI